MQLAILASCREGPHADLIIGRASVIDCFQSVVKMVPSALVDQWRQQGAFDFPVGGVPVRLSSELIGDIDSRNLPEQLLKLRTPVHLVHGKEDKTVPLSVIQHVFKLFPFGLGNLTELPGAGHELSNDPSSEAFRWMV